MKVSVDTYLLREGAAALSGEDALPRGPMFDVGDLGSSRVDTAYVEFERYWGAGRSALTQSTEALAGVLRSAASTYARRDADHAQGFGAGAHAF